MRIEKICYNCAYSTLLNSSNDICPICHMKLQAVSFFLGKKLINMNEEQRRQWVEKEIGHPISKEIRIKYKNYCNKKSKELPEQLERERKEREHKALLEQQAKNIARMQKESDKHNCTPQCPICGSTNINKITVTKRVTKTAVFGALGAIDDAGKTWQCNNCGSKF